MTIVLLHYSAPPVVGGVESVLAHQARLFAWHDHPVRILAGRGGPAVDGVPVVRLPELDSRHPKVLFVKRELDRGRVPALFAELRDRIADQLSAELADARVVIAHNVCSLHKNLALTAALHRLAVRRPPWRLVLWHHDLAWTTARYRHELHDGYPWDLLRTEWGGRHVAVSASRKSEVARLFGLDEDAVAVVPNGVDLEELLDLEPGTCRLVRRLGLLAAAPLLLLPVRITPRKNIELALKVLAALREQMPTARLVVTGPPGAHNPANARYLQRLKALRAELGLEDAAHFMVDDFGGPLSDRMVADLYRLADGVLLTSLEEGFGIPLLEAAVHRVPVFCSAISPLLDLGAQDVTYFDPQAEPADIANAIAEQLGASPTYCFAVRVRQELTWDRIFERYLEPLVAT